MKLELGAGYRPTRGYQHNDLHPFHHIEHPGEAWMLDLPNDSCTEILALGFVEHLTYYQTLDTLRNMRRILQPGGLFLFDVPDYPRWVGYYLNHLNNEPCPVTMDHVRRTLFGWGRWDGDYHMYGWDRQHLEDTLETCGFTPHIYPAAPAEFINRTHRDRFHIPTDAHLYVVAR